MNEIKYQTYINIMKKELVPAMGCTEPVAIAFCAAKAKQVLNKMPEKVMIETSGNIIKNAKSVVVPNTQGLKGIEVAAAMGIVAGDANLGLEVISKVDENILDLVKDFMKNVKIEVKTAEQGVLLDINVTLIHQDERVSVRIMNQHTNIVLIKHNDEVLFDDIHPLDSTENLDYELLNMKDIYEFSTRSDISELEEIIQKQIKFNTEISQEGLSKDYGANIGKMILKVYGNDVRNRSKAKTAAGSDARMNGSALPVVINSGSGNQGMTASLPVIEFAEELKTSKENLYRALVLSNLIAIYQKSQIGALSAFCGAVTAGAASGAAITYLKGGNYEDVAHTLINALAIASGIICDGAKASCAAKIAISVDAGILASDMHDQGKDFYAGDGIVGIDVDETIKNVGKLGREGMKETDKEILYLMSCFY
ncbi:MAG: L-serine ammonia-lyase, iron-sulfur-dependent, subunit alpha [Acholeplasmataceae bacterium]|nr:serine dehydratase subunit alpha family protein [Acholeplasmataceae bacterium]